MKQLLATYKGKKAEIASRLREFDAAGREGSKRPFSELAFRPRTPQSKARSCDIAIKELGTNGLLFLGNEKQIALVLAKKTRFHNNKAKYVVGARKIFPRFRR